MDFYQFPLYPIISSSAEKYFKFIKILNPQNICSRNYYDYFTHFKMRPNERLRELFRDISN